jgi:hypothetical protein
LIELAWGEIEPSFPGPERRSSLVRADDEVLERAVTGALLLALADPISIGVASRLAAIVETYLQALLEGGDDPVDKAYAFIGSGCSMGWRRRWARGFSRTLYIARLRTRLGWPSKPPTWNTLFSAVDGDYDWSADTD